MSDYGFKFKIGQFVQHVGAVPIAQSKRSIWPEWSQHRLLILERIRHEYAGGTETVYVCRLVKYDGHFHGELFKLNEIELTEAEEPSRTDKP